jgi:hypothetical protein
MGALAIAVLFSLALAAAPAAAQPVADRPLHTVHEDPAPFLFQSVGRPWGDMPIAAAQPVIGAFIGPFVTHGAQVDGGRKLVEEFKLPDPAPAIASRLGRETCPLVACTTVVPDVEDNALTLAVRTTNWMLTRLGSAWDRYRIYYKVDARLLDGARNKVLASAEYVYSEKYDDADKAPPLEELLRDDAALLKAKFREIEPIAVAELKEEIEKDLRHNGRLATSRMAGTNPAAYQGELK